MKCTKCPVDNPGPASMMCAACHAREVARIHAHDTPDVPMPPLPKYHPPPERMRGPTSSGRRVIRKSPMG